MDPKKQGEIALLLLKYLMRDHGIKLSLNNMRELGNLAMHIGISPEELKQFAKPLLQEFLDECFD